jgi:hypothetical protein
MKVHRLGIAGRQDQGCALALLRADGTEDVGRGGPLITGALGREPRFARRRVILFFWPRLIREPDFYLVAVNRRFAGNFIQARWEVFLKSSIAPRLAHGGVAGLRACGNPWRAGPGSASVWRP